MQMQIWQDKIVLRLKEEIHPKLQKYARYNDKVHGYLLAFGKQNLQRIHSVYGPIADIKGFERIEDLKVKNEEINKMARRLLDIKGAETLPSIEYKMPPLGDYQHRGICFLLENKRSPLFADCGVGKSFMILVSCEEHIRTGKTAPGKTLICGKLATLETGWMEDTKKFTNLKANLVWLPSSTHKRKERLTEILNDPADIYIINHDGVLVLEEELAAKNFEKVVIDESTILKSYHGDFTRTGGAFGKAIMNVAKNASWRVIMSGTPAPNGPEDLWGQFKFLDPEGIVMEPAFNDFRATYMEEIVFGRQPNAPKKYVFKKHLIPYVGGVVSSLAYQVKIRDHLHDLPAKTVIQRKVLMSKEQQAHYLEMKEGLATTLAGEFISVEVQLAQLAKLRQITGGFLIDQEEKAHPIKTATKLAAMDDLLEEIGDEKIVIYAQYRWEIKTLAERYKHKGVVTVYGENSSDDNLEHIKAFIKNPDVKLIILHPKSAAHGVTFTVSHYMVFYSISFSAEDDYQCVARIERAGQKHPMFVYYLLSKMDGESKESVDEVIYRVLRMKGKNQDELLSEDELVRKVLAEV